MGQAVAASGGQGREAEAPMSRSMASIAAKSPYRRSSAGKNCPAWDVRIAIKLSSSDCTRWSDGVALGVRGITD